MNNPIYNLQQQNHNSPMQQHYQVINLHNIIRSQQAKIQQLREQLRIANEREENRYGIFIQNNKISLDQKDKMIQYLKGELERCNKNLAVGVTDVSQRFQREKDKLEKQIMNQKRKCLELEAKLKRSENQYETHLRNLTQENKKYIQEIRKYNESKTALTIEVTKLNHFYKNSLFQISKRKETLLWVDKFTQYLESSEMKEKRTLEDVSNFVKNQVNSLKTSLAQMVGEINKNQIDIHAHKNNTNGELIRIGQKIKEECEKILEENDHFWNQTIKQEKESQKSQEIKVLTLELEKQQEKHAQEIEELKNKIKVSQSEKKTIILGFQELRSLTEQKQANYREEIKHLKKNIEELMERATERDKEFEREIKTLTTQIENISERYYENIENPARRANMKVTEDMEQVRAELSKIQSNDEIKTSVEKLQKLVEAHIQARTQSELEQYLMTSNHILEEMLELVHQGSHGSSASKTYTSRGNTFDRELEEITEEEQVVLKEKLNKSQYEIGLAKKHLAKLKEYCEGLEKKNHPVGSAKKGQKNAALSQKVMELESQNEALKESIDHLKTVHRQQKQQILRKAQLRSSSEQHHISTASAVKDSIAKINDLNRKVEEHLYREVNTLNQMKENLKVLKLLLVKPIQSLDLITHHLNSVGGGSGLQIKISSQVHSHINKIQTDRLQIGGITQRSYHSIFVSSDEIRNYKEILNKRSQIQSTTNRLMSDLIRTLRESYQKQPKDKVVKKQEEIPQKRPELRLKNIQKRLRQLQTTKLKSHNELLETLSKLEQNQQKLNTKISKSASLKSTLNKFESNLDSKINEIVNKTQIKLDRSEIIALKDQVIADLRAKLQEAVYEGEGLRKEMNILVAEKRM